MSEFCPAIVVCLTAPFLCALLFLVPVWGPRLLFRRLNRQPASQLPTTFSTADALTLLVYLTIANALTTLLRSELTTTYVVGLAIAGNVLMVCTWLLGLRIMRRHGIASPRSRLLFQIFLHPMAIVAPAGVICNAMLLLGMLEAFEVGIRRGLVALATSPFPLVAFGMLCVSLWFCYVARQCFLRMLNSQRGMTTLDVADTSWPKNN